MIVKGLVSFQGQPVRGVAVELCEYQLGSSPSVPLNILAAGVTDPHGRYVIDISTTSWSGATYFVQAISSSGDKHRSEVRKRLVSSTDVDIADVEIKTGHTLELDIAKSSQAVTDAISELGGNSLPITSLGDVDLEVLRLSEAVQTVDVARVRDAEDIAQKFGIDADIAFSLGKSIALDSVSVAGTPRARLKAALKRSRDEGDFEDSDGSRIDAALDAIASHAWTELKGVTVEPARYSLKKLFDLADLVVGSEDDKVAAILLQHEGDAAALWGKLLSPNSQVPATKITRLQGLTELCQFTNYHWPLVEALGSTHNNLNSLSGLTRDEWLGKIQTAGVPEWASRANIDASTYALEMYAQLEDRFPNVALARALSTHQTVDELKDVADFLTGPHSFDFFGDLTSGTNSDLFESEFGTQTFSSDVRSNTLRLKRLMRFAPRGYECEVAMACYKAGYMSTADAGADSLQFFVQKISPHLPSTASNIPPVFLKFAHDNARKRGSLVSALSSVVSASRELTILAPQLRDVPELPNYNELFDTKSACKCSHCQSMLSPSAYLVDLLEWVRRLPADSADANMLEVLRSSHGHITALKLSCSNATTQLPLIDLVLEELEQRVTLGLVPLPDETKGDTAQLRAYPQSINAAAYTVLKQREYPLSLPFDLSFEEVNASAAPLGTTQAEVLSALAPATDSAPVQEVAWAQAHLGANPEMWALLLDEDSTEATSRWGGGALSELKMIGTLMKRGSQTGYEPLDFESVMNLMRSTFVQSANSSNAMAIWIGNEGSGCDLGHAEITYLSELALDRMHRLLRLHRLTGWSIEQLDRLIDGRGGLLDEDTLIEAARLSELLPMLGTDLDTLLDWRFGVPLRSWAGRLRRGLDASSSGIGQGWIYRPEEEEVGGPGSRYAQIFARPVDRQLGDLELQEGPTSSAELSVIGQAPHAVSNLLSALKLTQADVQALMPALGAVLNKDVLMAFNTHAGLARALRRPVEELVALLALGKVETGPTLSLISLLNVVELNATLRAGNIEVSGVAALLFADSTPDDEVAEHLGRIRGRVNEILRSMSISGVDVELVAEKLINLASNDAQKASARSLAFWAYTQDLVDANEVDWTEGNTYWLTSETQLEIEGHFGSIWPGALAALSYAHTRVTQLTERQILEQSVVEATAAEFGLESASALELLSRVGDFAITSLLAPALSESLTSLIQAASEGVAPVGTTWRCYIDADGLFTVESSVDFKMWGHSVWGLDLVVRSNAEDVGDGVWRAKAAVPWAQGLVGGTTTFTIASPPGSWSFTPDLSSGPYRNVRSLVAAPFGPVDNDSNAGPEPEGPLTSASLEVYHRLAYAARLVKHLRLTAAELPWVLDTAPVLGYLDILELPSTTLADDIGGVRVASWLKLVDALALNTRFDGRLFEVLNNELGTNLSASGIERISAMGGWRVADVATLSTEIDNGGIPHLLGADWRRHSVVEWLLSVLDLGHRLDASADQLLELIAVDADSASRAVFFKTMAARRFTPDRWLKEATIVRDGLRIRQRDALVDAVRHQLGLDDTSAVSDQLLTDVLVGPCQLTSRTKNACSQVQIFINRTFLGLEGAVHIAEPDSDAPEAEETQARADWRWMKLYRVWEANRKVFLYPENWLEPGLHPEPSPLYEAFEAALAKGELTHERAEEAVADYARSIADLGDLRIVAARKLTDDRTTHFIGRTAARPYRFFHRKHSPLGWHPWRSLDLPISDNEVFARSVRINGRDRLWLGWVQWESAGLAPDDYELEPGEGPDALPEFFEGAAHVWIEHTTFDGASWSEVISSDKVGSESVEYSAVRDETNSVFGGHDYQDLFDEVRFVLPRGWVADADGYPEMAAMAYRSVSRNFRANNFFAAWEKMSLPGRDGEDLFPEDGDVGPRFDSDTQTVVAQGDGYRPGAPPRGIMPLKFPYFFFNGRRFPSGAQSAAEARHLLREKYEEYNRFKDVTNEGAKSALVAHYPQLIRGLVTKRDVVQVRGDGRNFTVFLSSGTHEIELGRLTLKSSGSLIKRSRAVIISEAADAASLDDSLINAPTGIWQFDSVTSKTTIEDERTNSGVAVIRRVHGQPMTMCFLDGENQTPWRLDTRFGPGLRSASLEGVEAIYNLQKAWFGSAADRAIFAPVEIDTGSELRFDGGPFAQYNWELFYHLPLKVADALRQQQRFEEALRWIHFIFDPTRKGGARVKWVSRPLRALFTKEGRAAEASMRSLAQGVLGGEEGVQLTEALNAQVTAWMDNPFDPHMLARVRPEAYAKRAVFAYLDILADWADQLFRRDTIESTTEANQLYRLAVDLLGPPTQVIPQGEQVDAQGQPVELPAYDDLDGLDALSNARIIEDHLNDDRRTSWDDALAGATSPVGLGPLVQDYNLSSGIRLEARLDLEARFDIQEIRYDFDSPVIDPFDEASTGPQIQMSHMHRAGDRPTIAEQMQGYVASGGRRNKRHMGSLPPSARWAPSLLFCLPGNEKLTSGYRALLADRLFKLRHCMNIDGVKRSLALFEPPIDPGLLVRARAVGVGIADALSQHGGRSLLRFEACIGVAQRLVTQVRQLSQAVLAATEKRDAEGLAQLRVGHERTLNDAVMLSRKEDRRAAKESVKALKVSLKAAEDRYEYYSGRETYSSGEKEQIDLLIQSEIARGIANTATVAMQVTSKIPVAQKGVCGTGLSYSIETNPDRVPLAIATAASAVAAGLGTAATIAGLDASLKRRKDDWKNLARQARFDMQSLERQIVAAELRVAISEHEIATQRLRTKQSSEVAKYLSGKFTNVALYDWMLDKLQGLHFQSYNIAFDYARKAELAWQFERVEDRDFVSYGEWDGLKRGLLAAEQLELDLTRMQTAWHENNRREYELTRHVSLLSVDPEALNELRTQGSCRVVLPESLFDMDAPGHYLRRIKTVALSLPSVTGPYVPVHCTLTLERSSLRVSAAADSPYESSGVEDARFAHDRTAIESIVTSQAQADAGLFEVPLNDARYLPFEGAGAVSQWRLELPSGVKHFDYATISDAILHLRYTAREGGLALREKASDSVKDQLETASPPIAAGATASEAGALNLIFQALKPTQLEQLNATNAVTIEIEGVPYAAAQDNLAITEVSKWSRATEEADWAIDANLAVDYLPPVDGVVSAQIQKPANIALAGVLIAATYGVNNA